MSEMVLPTGATRPNRCKLCQAPTTQREYRGIFFGTQSWMTNEHDAPCGQPCLGGGLRREARLRLQVFHPWVQGAHGWKTHGRRACPQGCSFPRVQRRVHARTHRLSST